jgi:uncharacterized protein (TIGR02145 family)
VSSCGEAVTYEGYSYSTVQIGSQCWFSENCRYLPSVSPSSDGSETTPYYYVYSYQGTDVTEAQDTDYYSTYGVLYNWSASMVPSICPSGWHVPTDGELTQLIDFLGGESIAGDAMKSTLWWANFGNGTNSSGFSGLPGGSRQNDGFFYTMNYYGYFWSSSVQGSSNAWYRALYSNSSTAYRNNGYKGNGNSVRCLRD